MRPEKHYNDPLQTSTLGNNLHRIISHFYKTETAFSPASLSLDLKEESEAQQPGKCQLIWKGGKASLLAEVGVNFCCLSHCCFYSKKNYPYF